VKKKLLIVIPVVLLVAAAGAYKFVLAPKPEPGPPAKIAGTVVPLEKEFLVNLAAGRYAKVSVALVVEGHGGGHGAGESMLAQEAAVRAAVTDQLTGLPADMLVSRKHRHDVLEQVLEAIHATTDEHVERVLFTDITVQ
jgi:flagellar FliL protein